MIRTILTCSPYFVPFALNELRRSQPDLTVIKSLTDAHTLIEVPATFHQLTEYWQVRRPIYLHHLFPVLKVLPLNGDQTDVKRIQQAAREIAPSDARLQARVADGVEYPYCVYHIERRAPYAATPSGSVVSILIVPDSDSACAYMGESDVSENLSAWAGGQMPITEPVCNRAGYKLLEALTEFDIRLRQGDVALDLGASPGAWTTILRQRGLRVIAVAPTPLYPWLMMDRGVIHKRLLAEELLPHFNASVDLIVNDMKLDPQDSARLMVSYAAHLRQGGIAIMTLKLRSHNQARVMDHAFRILRKAYKIIRVRQLVSNKHEVTLFLRKHG